MVTQPRASVHSYSPEVAGGSVAAAGGSVAAAGGSVAAAGGSVAAGAPPQAANTKLARTSSESRLNKRFMFRSPPKLNCMVLRILSLADTATRVTTLFTCQQHLLSLEVTHQTVPILEIKPEKVLAA